MFVVDYYDEVGFFVIEEFFDYDVCVGIVEFVV